MNRVFLIILLVFWSIETAAGIPFAEEIPATSRQAADPWNELMQRNPYPYATSIPADHATAADGLYVKFEIKETPPIPCRRCPDYKPEGGWWKMSLRKGIFRIYHPDSGWKSIGTFVVNGNRIVLSNDPVCPAISGVYRWELATETIAFSVVEDKCSAGLRAKNMSHMPWLSCPAPSTEAAVSNRRPRPGGCCQQ